MRYVLFGVVGIAFVAVMFYVLGLVFSAGFDLQTGLIERWIVRATCDDYELTGAVRESTGAPVPFATIEAAVAGERFTTRSGPDGRYRVAGEIRDCDIARDVVQITVSADDYRRVQTLERFDRPSLDVVLRRESF